MAFIHRSDQQITAQLQLLENNQMKHSGLNIAICLICLPAILLGPAVQSSNGAPPTQVAGKIVVGLFAAYAAKEAYEASSDLRTVKGPDAVKRDFTAELARRQTTFEDETYQRLSQQGLDARRAAIYSIVVNLDGDSSAVKWENIFSRPDIFFCFDSTFGRAVYPDIHYQYRGGPVLETFSCEEVPAGNTFMLRVMSDHRVSDSVWKGILQTPLHFKIGVDGPLVALTNTTEAANGLVVSSSAVNLIPVTTTAAADLQLLSPNFSGTIVGPNEIASLLTVVPNSKDGLWSSAGIVVDYKNRAIGTLKISCAFSGHTYFAKNKARFDAQERELASLQIRDHEVQKKSMGWLLFWCVSGALALASFAWQMWRERSSKSP